MPELKEQKIMRPVCKPDFRVLFVCLNIWRNGGSRKRLAVSGHAFKKTCTNASHPDHKKVVTFSMAPSSHFFSQAAAILCAGVAMWSDVCIPVFWLTAFLFVHTSRDESQGWSNEDEQRTLLFQIYTKWCMFLKGKFELYYSQGIWGL